MCHAIIASMLPVTGIAVASARGQHHRGGERPKITISPTLCKRTELSELVLGLLALVAGTEPRAESSLHVPSVSQKHLFLKGKIGCIKGLCLHRRLERFVRPFLKRDPAEPLTSCLQIDAGFRPARRSQAFTLRADRLAIALSPDLQVEVFSFGAVLRGVAARVVLRLCIARVREVLADA
jgi:hypothetical protein